MTLHFEKITNLILLKNNLYHIGFEIEKTKPSFARIGKESHLALYRAMVEALKGSANLSITGRPKSKKREAFYKIGDRPHYKIEKEKIKECKHAWRYSTPVIWPEPEHEKRTVDFYKDYKFDDYLLGFYDLLAMIQTECYMSRYVHSKPIYLNDKEMKLLEWLHEQIRNEYEHFIPKYYSVAKYDLNILSILCLETVRKLIYESGNVYDHPRGIKTHLFKSIKKLTRFKVEYEKKYIKKSNKMFNADAHAGR